MSGTTEHSKEIEDIQKQVKAWDKQGDLEPLVTFLLQEMNMGTFKSPYKQMDMGTWKSPYHFRIRRFTKTSKKY